LRIKYQICRACPRGKYDFFAATQHEAVKQCSQDLRQLNVCVAR
jgi:hypothetical protein